MKYAANDNKSIINLKSIICMSTAKSIQDDTWQKRLTEIQAILADKDAPHQAEEQAVLDLKTMAKLADEARALNDVAYTQRLALHAVWDCWTKGDSLDYAIKMVSKALTDRAKS